MSLERYEDGASERLRGLVTIVDSMLPPDEANALTHYHDLIFTYVEGALFAGLSLAEIRRDLDDVQDLWGFGPWGVLLEDGCLFLVANASVEANCGW